jgi:hypothetical protein
MFGPGGQRDYRGGIAYGGKGGGGGSQYQPLPPTVLTDPVSGKSFIQQNDPYSPNYDPNGKSAVQQLNEEIDQRKAEEKAASDAAKAQTTQNTQQATTDFAGRKQAAYDTSMQQVMRQFQLQGVDPAQYMSSDIAPALSRQLQSVQDMDPNPTASFPTNLGDTIIGNVVSGKRTQAGTALNNIFKPTYADEALPDSLTGQYANSILSEQFDPLSAQLTNAQKRGTLSGAGYNAALDALNQKKTAAAATIGDLGKGILAADRSGINDYISGARTNVNNLGLADTFDPTSYAGTAQGKVASDVGAFGGALRNAVGDTQFANISDLINAGGAAQGAQNPNAANPNGIPSAATGGGQLSPSFISQDELAKQKRGLGSTGAF